MGDLTTLSDESYTMLPATLKSMIYSWLAMPSVLSRDLTTTSMARRRLLMMLWGAVRCPVHSPAARHDTS